MDDLFLTKLFFNSKTEHIVTAAFIGSLQVTVPFKKKKGTWVIQFVSMSNNGNKCLFVLSKRPTVVTPQIIHVYYIVPDKSLVACTFCRNNSL